MVLLITVYGCTVLSKCANPMCTQQWHYLHEGRVFHLTPTPEIQALVSESSNKLYERFWLCNRCSKEMTLVWGGTHMRLVPLPANPFPIETVAASRVVIKRDIKKGTTQVALDK